MKISTPTKLLRPQSLFLLATAFLVLINAVDFLAQTAATRQKRKTIPYYFLGLKFAGLKEMFRNVPFAGYYTDRNLNEKTNAAEFAQAQYVLAPTILELNHTGHEWTFFDCASEEKAAAKIREIGAEPVKRNAFGIVITRKVR